MGGPHVTEIPDEALGRSGGPRHAAEVALGQADETWPRIVEDGARGELKEVYAPVDGFGQERKPTLQDSRRFPGLRNGFGRVLLVCIVAGIVANILAYLADVLMLAARWTAAMKTLGRSELSVKPNRGIQPGLTCSMEFLRRAVCLDASPLWCGAEDCCLGRTRRPGNHSVLLPNASLTAVAGFSPPNLTAMANAAAIVESVAATMAEAA
jgi:hypothetical protein